MSNIRLETKVKVPCYSIETFDNPRTSAPWYLLVRTIWSQSRRLRSRHSSSRKYLEDIESLGDPIRGRFSVVMSVPASRLPPAKMPLPMLMPAALLELEIYMGDEDAPLEEGSNLMLMVEAPA